MEEGLLCKLMILNFLELITILLKLQAIHLMLMVQL